MNDSYLASTRQASEERFTQLKSDLEDAEPLIAGKACVYATGSFGRFEAGSTSDLDLFIVVDSHAETKDNKIIDVRALDGIDEIRLKYQLISAVENRGIAEFDGGGKYLEIHTIKDFTANLGSPDDDSKNTFTGRLLMLLESRPLMGDEFYDRALMEVISAYFIDYEGNEENFVPAFLINDIMRMWRTFCVNYEFYRTKGTVKSKIKNLKLKHSRMLTCYSAIIYLLAFFSQHGTVRPEDVRQMADITPLGRLEAISQNVFWESGEVHTDLRAAAENALRLYSEFLQLVHKGKAHLEEEFATNQAELREKSHKFGAELANMMDAISSGARHAELFRFVLI